MEKDLKKIRVLLVDDEEDFRKSFSQALNRRGFDTTAVAGGAEALESIQKERPDIVILDLNMPGMSGTVTLKIIRDMEQQLPVIILTGHGNMMNAMSSITLKVSDFMQKPVDIEQLSKRIRTLLEQESKRPLRERRIAEVMVSPSQYSKLYVDESIITAAKTLKEAVKRQIRSALVYDRKENFLGLIRFIDLLKLVLPQFLKGTPYTTFFSGMFLAQIKVVGNRNIQETMEENIYVDLYAPIMEAVHLMVNHHLINIPVMNKGKLLGIIREHDIILEIAQHMEF